MKTTKTNSTQNFLQVKTQLSTVKNPSKARQEYEANEVYITQNFPLDDSEVVFDDAYKECEVHFSETGGVFINPLPGDRYPVTAFGEPHIAQQGKMITDRNGTAYFRPYHRKTGERYRYLLRTAYGNVKEGNRSYIFTICLPKRMGRNTLSKAFNAEARYMAQFTKQI